MRAVVVGVGNRDRGDDAAGLEVARRLEGRVPPGVRVLESGGGLSLLEAWRGAALAIVVDAASSGAPAGAVARLEAHDCPLPARWLDDSTHSWGVAEAVELARALGELPPRVFVYAIEGGRFDPGAGLSREVEAAVDEVAASVLEELGKRSEVPVTVLLGPSERRGADGG